MIVGLLFVGNDAVAPGPARALASTTTSARETRDPSGLMLVGPSALQFAPTSEAEADAFDDALNLALAHRDTMGYPWIDSTAKTLRLTSTSTEIPAALVERNGLRSSGLSMSTAAGPTIARLDAIADDVASLSVDAIAHAELIYMTEPDQKNNRIIITVSELNSELMKSLAERYGTELIAVRVQAGGPATAASNRDSDAPAFWGGAYMTTSTGKQCTTGFAWARSSTQSAMLTAAHCISSGGWVSYPNYTNAGAVQSGSLENWSDSGGTEYYTGQTVYRGDVALIQYGSGYSSSASIYSGAAHTGTSKTVRAMNSRWAQNGDAVCVNGVRTGEWCGTVNNTGINIWYVADGLTVVAKHMVQAFAYGNTCPTHGDSGAPVYQNRSDGKVTAFGIFSGSTPLGVSCYVYFTDIQDAYQGLPGALKTAL